MIVGQFLRRFLGWVPDPAWRRQVCSCTQFSTSSEVGTLHAALQEHFLSTEHALWVHLGLLGAETRHASWGQAGTSPHSKTSRELGMRMKCPMLVGDG